MNEIGLSREKEQLLLAIRLWLQSQKQQQAKQSVEERGEHA